MRYIPSTVIVTFYHNIADDLIEKLFDQLKVAGNQASSLIKRYAVDVPVGEENQYLKLFANNEYVKETCKDFIPGRARKKFVKDEEEKEEVLAKS